jgi:hypothetical protein
MVLSASKKIFRHPESIGITFALETIARGIVH